jgi:uncharacterized protein
MVLPIGSIVNMAAVIAGSLLGLMLNNKFPENIRKISFQAIGLCTILIGVQMAMKVEDLMLVIFSMLIGGIIGEVSDLDKRFKQVGNLVKKRLGSKNEKFTDGLITAFILYCVGSMTILGALDEGLRNNPALLYSKSVLDGFSSIVLASVYGSGVLFSAVPLFIFQAGITLIAVQLQPFLSDVLINQVSAVGGLLILGLALNLLEIKEVKVTNLLPALVVVTIFTLVKLKMGF